jgi:hypothetical protein
MDTLVPKSNKNTAKCDNFMRIAEFCESLKFWMQIALFGLSKKFIYLSIDINSKIKKL